MVSHVTTDHTTNIKPALSLSYCPESTKELFGKKRFLINWEESHAITYLAPQLDGDLVSCQHQARRSGAENGPSQGQTQTRTEASVQAWAMKLSALQGIGQGQCGVNSQRCQVGAGVLHWLVAQVKRPTRGQGDLPPSFLAWLTTTHPLGLSSDRIFLRQPPAQGQAPSIHILITLQFYIALIIEAT